MVEMEMIQNDIESEICAAEAPNVIYWFAGLDFL